MTVRQKNDVSLETPPSFDDNYLNLKNLDFSLKQSKKGTVYFKVTGKSNNRHVEAVHGRFSILFAKIACFFGVQSYDLQNVSSVMQKQISQLQETLPTIELALEKADRQKVCRSVSKLFISCIGSSGTQKRCGNRALPQTSRESIVWKIKEIMRQPQINPTKSEEEDFDFESIFATRDSPITFTNTASTLKNPLLQLVEKNQKVFESILDIKTSYILEQKTTEKLKEVMENVIQPQIQRCIASKETLSNVGGRWFPLPAKGKYARADTLAHACFEKIWNRLESASKTLDEENISVLTEAKCFLVDAKVEEAQSTQEHQAARAVAVIELREFLAKVEEFIATPDGAPFKNQIDGDIADLKNGLGFYADKQMNFFSASYLESITTEDVRKLHQWLLDKLQPVLPRLGNIVHELQSEVTRLPPDLLKSPSDKLEPIADIIPTATIQPLTQDIILSEKEKGALIRSTVVETKEIFLQLLGIDLEKELEAHTSNDAKMDYLTNIFHNKDPFAKGSQGNQFLIQLNSLKENLQQGVLYNVATRGSIASGVFSAISWNISNLREDITKPTEQGQIFQKERLQLLKIFCSNLAEAKTLLHAFGHKDSLLAEQLQHKRAVVLLEMRSLYRKAVEIALPALEKADEKTLENFRSLALLLAGPSGFVDTKKMTFSAQRLSAITDDELNTLKNQLYKVVKPIEKQWDSPLEYGQKITLGLPVLIKELEGRIQALEKFEKELPSKIALKKLEGIRSPPNELDIKYLKGIKSSHDKLRYLKKGSLSHALYQALTNRFDTYIQTFDTISAKERAQIAPTVCEAEWLLAAHDAQSPRHKQAQLASLCLELRELLTQTETQLQIQKKTLKSKHKQIEQELSQLWQKLGGKSSFADKHLHLFSNARLAHVTKEELEYIFNKLTEISIPLVTRGHWKAFGPLRREFEGRINPRVGL